MKKNEFLEEFLQKWKETGGIIHPADAAKLLKITRQGINTRLKQGSLTEVKIQKKTYIILEEVKELLIKRN